MTNTPRFFAAALLSLSCAKETPSEPEVVPSNAEAASSSSERATQASHAATSSSDASAGTADIETQTARDGSVTSAESRGETAGGHAETSDGAAPTSVTQDASALDAGTEPAPDAAVGEPFKRPQLVVSGVDNYWSEQDLVEVTGVKASFTINETATRQKWLGFSGGLNEA